MSRNLQEKIAALLAAERGTVYKARGAGIEIALAYPNTYHIGMSNLGVHRIYAILNARQDAACERVFLPDDEDREEYARTGRASPRSRPAARFGTSRSSHFRFLSSRTT